MILVPNKILPFKGFVAMAIWPFIFVRDTEYVERHPATLTHEKIHFQQQKELLLIGFYAIYMGFYTIYLFEWLYRLIFHTKTAYKGISFEVEAKTHQNDPEYISHRRHFAQWRKNTQ